MFTLVRICNVSEFVKGFGHPVAPLLPLPVVISVPAQVAG